LLRIRTDARSSPWYRPTTKPPIGDVIEALLAQERPLDRIVVVSDNSTDDTFAIASSYRDRGVVAVETSLQDAVEAR
jgi:cellulose synthase/poly-beta-1,6-N-acetylglucosamine synthase-like glycosyltransferase